MPGKLYIETVGCQMSVLDSELVVGSLRRQGYSMTADAADADVVLFNTCSIRETAEEKIYLALSHLKKFKRNNPEAVIGVLGCMAQKDQEKVFARAPHVDLVCGPGALGDIPDMIEEIRRTRIPKASYSLGRKEAPRREVEQSFASWDPDRDPEGRPTRFQAFVRTQFGCDKFCTYCIVPAVRGPEQGRDPDELLEEVRRLVDQGVVEVTLVGQTVNSYRHGKLRFADLLARLHETPGLSRIKFVSSFPNDMTDDLLQAIRDLPKIGRNLHVPAQSGSDTVLARMKRHYSVTEYVEMVARARETIPGVTISGDFIVGFCGETEEDFQKTCELVRTVRFKSNFIYQYSTRPGTKAHDDLPDDVPSEVKMWRNNELLGVQGEVSKALSRSLVGTVMDVLVEGPSVRSNRPGFEGQLAGRTATDHAVVFDGAPDLIGRFVPVQIEDATSLTLFGRVEGAPRTEGPVRPAAPRSRLPVVTS
jgi:tRNA-2-methylthio-N6-dimethylallyladenosine synthase